MKINEDNIGKFFQESLKDLEVQPDKAVWSSIETKAGISQGMSIAAKAILAVSVVAIAVISAYFIMQNNELEQMVEVQEELPVEIPVETSNVDIQINTQDTTLSTEEEIISMESETPVIEEPKDVSPVKTKAVVVLEKIELKEEAPMVHKEKETVAEVKKDTISAEQELYNAKLVDFSTDSESIVDQDDATQVEEVVDVSSDSVDILFSENPVICFGEDAVLIVKGGVSYLWNTGANTSMLKVSPVQNSEYWVEVTDVRGNKIKHTFAVSIDRECSAIFVPSAFTPNSDGINDVFKAEGLGIQSFNMVIFSREGQIVFESNNIDDAWDGSSRNSNMSSRVYFYKIAYVDAKGNAHNKQGQVTLIR
jgi:gliding motility-associated-like protein